MSLVTLPQATARSQSPPPLAAISSAQYSRVDLWDYKLAGHSSTFISSLVASATPASQKPSSCPPPTQISLSTTLTFRLFPPPLPNMYPLKAPSLTCSSSKQGSNNHLHRRHQVPHHRHWQRVRCFSALTGMPSSRSRRSASACCWGQTGCSS